jgi:hypothetical protein
MGGRYYSISPDEYVFAALNIYLVRRTFNSTAVQQVVCNAAVCIVPSQRRELWIKQQHAVCCPVTDVLAECGLGCGRLCLQLFRVQQEKLVAKSNMVCYCWG